MSDDRPDALAFDPEPVPEDLREREQWVAWRYRFDADRDEWTKVPVDVATGGFAKSTDPDTWTTFGEAVAYHDRADTNADGVGFVVSDDDLVVGFDCDDCRDPDTGDVEPWAADLVDEVPTYAEVSPSGTGVRLFGLGILPDGGNRADVEDAEGHLEMYDSGRYLTVTGHALDGTPADVCQVNDEIAAVHAEYIADDPDPEPTAAGDGGVDTRTPATTGEGDASGPSALTDEDQLSRARNAENGAKFARLFDRGDTSGYPSHSEADLALCGLLAFWTGGDRDRIDRLFRRSALCRDKWTERADYRERTIDKALSGRTDYYDPEHDDGRDRPAAPTEADIDGTGVELRPSAVKARANLGTDGDVSDLTDREKAACVWDLVMQSDEFHVRVRRDNGSLWAYDGGVWKPEGDRALRHAGRRALGSMNYGQNVLDELKAQARGDPRVEVTADDFGVRPGTVAVANGLLDLNAAAEGASADALRDLRPDDYALAQLPVKYDPDAAADEWKTFVGDVVEPAKIDAVQEYVGYTLHRGAIPFHKALLCVGSGSNGKSTFLNVVRALLGEDHTTSKPVHKFDQDNHVADLYGALANIDADLSEGSLSGKGIATFKRLVGGDTVDARRLYKDAFSFEPTAKHLYACNQVPDVSNYVSDHDIAFWRRWIIVEFPNWFPEGSVEALGGARSSIAGGGSTNAGVAGTAAGRGPLGLLVGFAEQSTDYLARIAESVDEDFIGDDGGGDGGPGIGGLLAIRGATGIASGGGLLARLGGLGGAGRLAGGAASIGLLASMFGAQGSAMSPEARAKQLARLGKGKDPSKAFGPTDLFGAIPKPKWLSDLTGFTLSEPGWLDDLTGFKIREPRWLSDLLSWRPQAPGWVRTLLGIVGIGASRPRDDSFTGGLNARTEAGEARGVGQATRDQGPLRTPGGGFEGFAPRRADGNRARRNRPINVRLDQAFNVDPERLAREVQQAAERAAEDAVNDLERELRRRFERSGSLGSFPGG